MKKTLIPNSIILFLFTYITVMGWGIIVAENRYGIFFYGFSLFIFFVIVIYNREPQASILKIEDNKLKVKYFFPNNKDIEVDFYKIQGNMILRRYYDGKFAGGLPSWPEYLNYRWYFSPERYELELTYGGEHKVLSFQVNIILFKRFLETLVESTNSINKDKIQQIESTTGKSELMMTFSELVIKLIIAG